MERDVNLTKTVISDLRANAILLQYLLILARDFIVRTVS